MLVDSNNEPGYYSPKDEHDEGFLEHEHDTEFHDGHDPQGNPQNFSFTKKLFEILNDEHNHEIISWSKGINITV